MSRGPRGGIPALLALAGLLAFPLETAGAVDPWQRPGHLRAVAEPPVRWGDLDQRRRAVRLWWDQACLGEQAGSARWTDAWVGWAGERCATATVQVDRGGRWRVVARAVGPGWQSPPVADGTRFRVRLSTSGWSGRWSEPVRAAPWTSPSDLARVGAPPGALLGARVGQVSADLATGQVWASTLGGGAAALTPEGTRATPVAGWEGLPDDRAVAIDHAGTWTLVGTGAGAALLEQGRVVRVWDSELPDPWVQAVALEGERLWLGTYQGLARVDAGGITVPLAPWSVFSLAPASGGGVWAGYDGLARVAGDGTPAASSASGEPATRLPGEHLYGVVEHEGQVVVASEESGRRRLPVDPGAPLVDPAETEEAYAVAPVAGGDWVARGPRGLEAPGGQRLGRGQGLPSDTAWAVEDAGAGAWVGTNAGLARVLPGRQGGGAAARIATLPLSPWPADSGAVALLARRRGAWLAGPGGVAVFGRPHRAGLDLAIAARQPLVALLDDGHGGAWAIGASALHLDRRGRLHQVELPAPARAAALHEGALWIATAEGLWRRDPDSAGLALVSALPGVQRLVDGGRALWAVAERRVVRLVAGAPRPFLQTHPALAVAPDPHRPDEVWVGTEQGLERLTTRGESEGEVVDVLGEADRGVVVPAVAADGRGGCWMAAADGTVAHVDGEGARAWVNLPEPDPPWPVAIVLDPRGDGDVAWVLTERGTWRIRLPLGR